MNRKVKHKAGHLPKPMAKSRPRTRADPGTRMSVLLANPDYLLEGFAEKRCKYIGQLDVIPTNKELNDRVYLLATLDTNRNAGKLPWQLGLENEVSVTISAFNMKIIREDRNGTVLHRVPIHQIACCCYVNDDDQHLLFIRAGDSGPATCPVYVMTVDKRGDAEELCTILQEVFQLVYTEATVQHLNESITAGERGTMTSSVMTSLQRRQKPTGGDRQDVDEEDGAGEREGGGEGGPTAEELVQQYMERLHKLLDFKELREFASLLKQYRDDLPVGDFLSRLRELYGPQRSFLIPGMRYFIPDEDRAFFDSFLNQHNLPVDQSDSSGAATKPHPPPPPAREGKRGRKRSQAHVADVDKFLADIDSHAESMMDTSNF